MPASIRITGALTTTATVSAGRWSSPNRSIEGYLNTYVDDDRPHGGAPLDIALAEAAIRRLNERGFKAELIDYEKPDYIPGRIY